MDLQRMLGLCRSQQWGIDDLDWEVPARSFEREDEIAVVQYFTDMAGIELLAGALFEVQQQKSDDPLLREIFASFVKDERRHSQVALRLAAHYNRHHYRSYRPNPALVRFRPRFVEVVRQAAPGVANLYITTGELLLDIALLRSLDDFVDDPMSRQAMRLINRDESRHIAVDYHMVAYYASDAYAELEARQNPRNALDLARQGFALTRFIASAAPFFRDVFFTPLDRVDPSGHRLLEAFKRIQLLGQKPSIARHPFSRFLSLMQELYEHPLAGIVLGPAIVRFLGLDPRVIGRLYDDEEARRAARMSVDALAAEALAVKSQGARFSKARRRRRPLRERVGSWLAARI